MIGAALAAVGAAVLIGFALVAQVSTPDVPGGRSREVIRSAGGGPNAIVLPAEQAEEPDASAVVAAADQPGALGSPIAPSTVFPVAGSPGIVTQPPTTGSEPDTFDGPGAFGPRAFGGDGPQPSSGDGEVTVSEEPAEDGNAKGRSKSRSQRKGERGWKHDGDGKYSGGHAKGQGRGSKDKGHGHGKKEQSSAGHGEGNGHGQGHGRGHGKVSGSDKDHGSGHPGRGHGHGKGKKGKGHGKH